MDSEKFFDNVNRSKLAEVLFRTVKARSAISLIN
jgi:hypothetical protein